MNLDNWVHLVITARGGGKQASAMVPATACLDAAREFAALVPRTATIALHHVDVPFAHEWRRSGWLR